MIRNKIAVLFFIISLVSVLLVASFFLLKRNSEIIDQNRVAFQEAASVKIKMGEVISNLHVLDLGIRGYALVPYVQMESPYLTAIEDWPVIHSQLDSLLRKQGFVMTKIDLLKDTVHSYVAWIESVKAAIDAGKRKEAIEMISIDKGYGVWLFHRQLRQEVDTFEDLIAIEAKAKYQSALRNSYLLQLVLVVFIMPTLIFLAYYTIRAFRLSKKLLESEAEKNAILSRQNETLEKLVQIRTHEIATQNEEILSQHEEIHTHVEQLLEQKNEIELQSQLLKLRNEQLHEANDLIAQQKKVIETENVQLASDLDQQNKELLQTNHELVQRNQRMEQFGYMVSHNLRAPIARISGLTSIFKYAQSKDEIEDLIQKTNQSASELDKIVQGISEILQIRRLSVEVLSEINFESILEKMKRTFESDINEKGVRFVTEFNIKSIFSLAPYWDSIFYNLISNAIKYNDPARKLVITLATNQVGEVMELTFTDNGLGFNDEVKKENIFGLFKRFHFHVEGRGIGLYLVKSQVEMLNGKIEVNSTYGRGSTFRILLPTKRN